MPAISIICPLYNKGNYIEETIRSVQAQSLADWQMIVVDNGSTDDGPELAQRLAVMDQRIHLVSSPKRGPGAARNFGLNYATGNWILFLDADDLLEQERLHNMVMRAAEVPECTVVASPWKEFKDGSAAVENFTLRQPAGLINKGENLADSAIGFTCWAVHAAIIKRTWLATHLWPEELDRFLAEDTAFWFRIVLGAHVAYSSCSGALYRTQTENCRSDYSADAWFEGNHHAVLSNLEHLRNKKQSVSGGQMDTLVRLYFELHLRARKSPRSEATAKRALQEAQMWMQRLRASGTPVRTSMKLRMLLGLQNFARLQGLTLKYSS